MECTLVQCDSRIHKLAADGIASGQTAAWFPLPALKALAGLLMCIIFHLSRGIPSSTQMGLDLPVLSAYQARSRYSV